MAAVTTLGFSYREYCMQVSNNLHRLRREMLILIVWLTSLLPAFWILYEPDAKARQILERVCWICETNIWTWNKYFGCEIVCCKFLEEVIAIISDGLPAFHSTKAYDLSLVPCDFPITFVWQTAHYLTHRAFRFLKGTTAFQVIAYTVSFRLMLVCLCRQHYFTWIYEKPRNFQLWPSLSSWEQHSFLNRSSNLFIGYVFRTYTNFRTKHLMQMILTTIRY